VAEGGSDAANSDTFETFYPSSLCRSRIVGRPNRGSLASGSSPLDCGLKKEPCYL